MKDYKKLYDAIITGAKEEERAGLRNKGNGNYYEEHHIKPKSLFPEESKIKSNLVLLTAEEHFVCHQYLTHIFPGSKMAFALHSFVSRPNADYKITKEEYARIKRDYARRMSEMQIGKKVSEETVQKVLATKKKNNTLNTSTRPEVRKKISETLKGNTAWNKGLKGNTAWNKGKKFPGKTNKTSFRRGDIPWNKGKKCEVFSKKKEDNPMYGKHWYTDGSNNVCDFECPVGYYPGVTRKIDEKKEEIRRQKISKACEGKKWFNNGKSNVLRFECPAGYVPGFLTSRVYKKKEKDKCSK